MPAERQPLKYANCWEDADLLVTRLGAIRGRQVLSIGSGGENGLSLLSGQPGRLVVVDVSPVQLFLFELAADRYEDAVSELLELFKTMEYGPAPESPAAARAWLETHGRKFGLFINNEWVTPKAARYYQSYDPSNGEMLGETVQAGQKEVDLAVAAARTAFSEWSKTPGVVRARHLYAIASNIQKHHRLLAVLESMDNGKPIRESRDIDVPLLARHFYYYAGWAQLMETELRDYQPLGVVGQIIPWNWTYRSASRRRPCHTIREQW